MGNEFKLERFGKRMPYRTPDGFLNAMEDEVIAKAKAEIASERRRCGLRLRIWAAATGIAAGVALLLTLGLSGGQEAADGFADVERAFAGISQEDQAYVLAVYNDDIFMEE